jgi:hypothetical protein
MTRLETAHKAPGDLTHEVIKSPMKLKNAMTYSTKHFDGATDEHGVVGYGDHKKYHDSLTIPAGTHIIRRTHKSSLDPNKTIQHTYAHHPDHGYVHATNHFS